MQSLTGCLGDCVGSLLFWVMTGPMVWSMLWSMFGILTALRRDVRSKDYGGSFRRLNEVCRNFNY